MLTTDSPRFRFRLPHWGWFLLATVVLVVGYVGLSVWLPWHREQQVIQMIDGFGGWAQTESAGPEWFRQLVGEDRTKEFEVFDRVVNVSLNSTSITDVEIAQLSRLTNLEYLELGGTAVTDTGIAHLSGLTKLDILMP